MLHYDGVVGFRTTQWSVVLAAGRSEPAGGPALEELCATYWGPLYAYLRRAGHAPPDAQDLTQEFFATLIENRQFAGLDPARGRFRSFMLAALRHFVANERDRVQARKRGGGAIHVPLDVPAAEERYGTLLAGSADPEAEFERQWALALLARVLARLREESVAAGEVARFEALKSTLTEGRGATPYAGIAERLGTSEGAVKVAVHRLRKRFREALSDEVAGTVESDGEVEAELRHLLAALSR